MSVQKLLVLVFICCFVDLVTVEASYSFILQLESYSNPANTLANGTCCECCEEGGSCGDNCTTQLQFCLRNSSHPTDDLNCPEPLGSGDAEPRGINFAVGGPYPGSVQLYLRITHDDGMAPEELIDALFIELNLTANDPHTPLKNFTGNFGVATLGLMLQIECAISFHGPDCSVFCMDMDNAFGHYLCNDDGSITCLDGYMNESSDCTECIPADGCSPLGGFCTMPGECQCREGYSGDNCTALDENVSTLTSSVILTGTTSSSPSLRVTITPSSSRSSIAQTSTVVFTSASFIIGNSIISSRMTSTTSQSFTRMLSTALTPSVRLPIKVPGLRSDDDDDADLIPLIVGGSISGVVLFVLVTILLAFLIIYLIKKRKEKKSTPNTTKDHRGSFSQQIYRTYSQTELEQVGINNNGELRKTKSTASLVSDGVESFPTSEQLAQSSNKRSTLPDATVITFHDTEGPSPDSNLRNSDLYPYCETPSAQLSLADDRSEHFDSSVEGIGNSSTVDSPPRWPYHLHELTDELESFKP